MRSDLSAAVLVDQRGLKRREKRPQDDEEGGDAREGERYARIEETWKPGKANWRQASTNSHQACTKANKNPSFTRNLGRTAGKGVPLGPPARGLAVDDAVGDDAPVEERGDARLELVVEASELRVEGVLDAELLDDAGIIADTEGREEVVVEGEGSNRGNGGLEVGEAVENVAVGGEHGVEGARGLVGFEVGLEDEIDHGRGAMGWRKVWG